MSIGGNNSNGRGNAQKKFNQIKKQQQENTTLLCISECDGGYSIYKRKLFVWSLEWQDQLPWLFEKI